MLVEKNDYTYDDIYGIDLDAYLVRQNTDINKLISQVKTDIEILRENLYKRVRIEGKLDQLTTEISKTLARKEQHLKRLLEWKKYKKKQLAER